MTAPTAKQRFTGSCTALVSLFKGCKLDEKANREHVQWQIAEGTSGLIPVGTTGESPTLSHAEHKLLVEWCVEEAKGTKARVMAGAGSNSTAEAVELARHAEKVGADGVLVVTPYYNKPSQEGMYQHFKAINDAIGIPVIIYNIPGRSIVDMSVDTMKRLYELKNITGIKDATGQIQRVTYQAMAMPGFNQLSGNDESALAFNAHGGDGCISVSSNVAPRLCAEFQAACAKGDYAKARKLNEKLTPLHTAMFLEPSPAPVKYALSLVRDVKADVRLPIVPVSKGVKKQIEDAMRFAGILN
jgi:4-hydroxy-tetrahydrodipicolinate synthase